MRILAAFGLLFCFGSAHSADCPIGADQLAQAGQETAMLVLSTSRCAALHELAAERLVATGESDPSSRRSALLARVRIDLRHGKLADAETHLRESRALLVAQRDADLAAGAPEYLVRSYADELARLDAMLAATRGNVAPPVLPSAPDAPWILQFGWCGTPMVSYVMSARVNPTIADALLATGHADWALQSLLSDEWQMALQLGTLPPRLRELAEAAFGPGSYEREMEAALAAVRFEVGPGGIARADFPFFGLTLPLPVGTKSWNAEQPTKFESADQVREYMRGLLASETETDEELDEEDFEAAIESDREDELDDSIQ